MKSGELKKVAKAYATHFPAPWHGQQSEMRFVDVVGVNPQTGESLIINIGRKTKSGIPVARERKALDDILFSPTLRSYRNSRLLFIEKGASGLPPGL